LAGIHARFCFRVLILLDDAIDALGESGKITLRTRRDGECIVVDLADTRPGSRRAFEPFFTTKDVGRGTSDSAPRGRS
jgi:C4-dicarboxylate-specific signal transduction histidine kinase